MQYTRSASRWQRSICIHSKTQTEVTCKLFSKFIRFVHGILKRGWTIVSIIPWRKTWWHCSDFLWIELWVKSSTLLCPNPMFQLLRFVNGKIIQHQPLNMVVTHPICMNCRHNASKYWLWENAIDVICACLVTVAKARLVSGCSRASLAKASIACFYFYSIAQCIGAIIIVKQPDRKTDCVSNLLQSQFNRWSFSNIQ